MAKKAITENEKTVLITIIAGLVLVAGWAGYAAVRGFSGAIPNLTATTSTILAVIAAVNIILIGVMTVVVRKA